MKFLFSIFSLILLFVSCVQVGTDELSIFRTQELDLSGPISFEDLRRNILEPKQCLRCHHAYATSEGLDEVIKKGKPQDSPLYIEISSGQMPKDAPPLSANNQEYVRLFILRLGGAANPVDPDEPQGEISFKELSNRIIKPHCIVCHKRWTDYKAVSKKIEPGEALESSFYTEIAAGSMPEDAAPLSLEDQEFVKRYIDTLKKKN